MPPEDPDGLLPPTERAFLAAARRAILVTIAADGRPRPVPICFVLDPDRGSLYTPIDDKPKRADDPLSLARVRDIARDPRVTILIDRWDEDWTRLAWLRVAGTATVIDPADVEADAHRSAARSEHARAVAALRAKYRQYETHQLEARPLIRVHLERATGWGALTEVDE